jgi:hypothetical protein
MSLIVVQRLRGTAGHERVLAHAALLKIALRLWILRESFGIMDELSVMYSKLSYIRKRSTAGYATHQSQPIPKT